MKERSKLSMGTIAILAGWAFTILAVIWQVAMKDAAYAGSIEILEEEVQEIKVRVDDTEEFRLEIVEQLTEIKTDLKWIKRKLDGVE